MIVQTAVKDATIGGRGMTYTVQRECDWIEDADGNYATECGREIMIICDTPEDNDFVFCPYCGKKINVIGVSSD